MHNPDDPKWLNRDRFILSARSWFDVPLQAGFTFLATRYQSTKLNVFRQLGSKDSGTSWNFTKLLASEATTGPLGQGVGNAVGYAVSARWPKRIFNTETHKNF